MVYYGLSGEVAHGDYMVGVCHAVALDAVDGGLGLPAGAVVLGGVHVHHSGFRSPAWRVCPAGYVSQSWLWIMSKSMCALSPLQ